MHESVTQDLGIYHIRTNAANKAKSVFRVTGLKILGWVGTHIFIFSFEKKNIIFCILKGILLSSCIQFYFFQKHEKNSRFHR